jgi:signal transduction histidine kinase
MLHEFLSTHRSELIDRCKAKALLRPNAGPLEPGSLQGIPRFLDQLVETLHSESSADGDTERLSGVSGAAVPARSVIEESAALRGRELLVQGFTVDEVVHEYGDLCQAVTELAADRDVAISVNDFHTLNRCLDNAIAGAVKEYAYGRRILFEDMAVASNLRHGAFVHEIRNLLHTMTLAFGALRTGTVAIGGATGNVLARSLDALNTLVERSVIDVRTKAETFGTHGLVSLSGLVARAMEAAYLQASERGCALVVSEIDATLAIDVDEPLVAGALANVLANAIKFTCHGTEVCVNAYADSGRILIAVTDNCGGIPQDVQMSMFQPFVQGGADRSGLGLGLAISRRYVEANHGTLTCRNVPEKGCVFTINLPRFLLPGAGIQAAIA